MIMGAHNDVAASGKIKPGKVGCEASESVRHGEGEIFHNTIKWILSLCYRWEATFPRVQLLRDACILGISMCSFTRTLIIIPILQSKQPEATHVVNRLLEFKS